MTEVEKILPIIPLRGITVFPNMVTYFDVGREKSINAVNRAMKQSSEIFLVPQRDDGAEEFSRDGILSVGTICTIKQIVNFNNGSMRVLVEGNSRATIKNIIKEDEFIEGEVTPLKSVEPEELILKVLKETLIDKFESFLKNAKIDSKAMENIYDVDNGDELVDIIAAYVVLDNKDRKTLIECTNIENRLELLLSFITKEGEILLLENKIKSKLNKTVEKSQKQYYLREQLNIIKEELGEDEENLVLRLKDRIKKAKMPKEIKNKLNAEVSKLERENIGSQEKGVIESYIEEVLQIPFGKYTKDSLDLKESKKILNNEHWGLEDIKEEILEYLAVKSFNKDIKLPVLCLVGPPGVGKTSIARSIANSLDRKFARISLGGINNEAEIRGHRKTYVGAMPGRIADALKKANSMNPVMLLDEIDKVGVQYKGDPYSALLEVLDKEQNKEFRDHYLEIDLDLSETMFIATANTLDTIPRPLLDRITIIELSGYTYEEKKHIAKNHLIPKLLKEHGVGEDSLKITDNAIELVISAYTRESGVRELNRLLIKVIRKSIKNIVENKKKNLRVNINLIEKFLGERIYSYDKIKENASIGKVNGMAWTAYGGDTLAIETAIMKGTGKLELTGKLGDVMKESAKTAYSYVRANSEKFNISYEEFYKNNDIHIHVPEGAVPKDGPSAGITMVTALVSLLSKRKVNPNVAMTGEVTLTGEVLPIGGLKEKILAATRVGVDIIIIPKKNEKDLKKIPKKILENIKVIAVEKVDTVIENALI